MKNKIYIAIICAFSIVFAVSSGFLIKHYCDSAKQAEIGYSDDQIVTVALSQVGNVGGQPYWSLYGFDSRVT